MIEQLRSLGLTEYEAKAYAALLQYGELDGKEAATHSLVPYSTVHFVLQQLVHKNFAVIVSKKPMRFKAIKPAQAIDSIVKAKTAELSNLKQKAIAELSQLKPKPLNEELEKVEVSIGAGQRFAHSTQLSREVKKEKIGITALDMMPIEVLKENIALSNRGVKCRFIATQFDEKNKGLIERLKSAGFKIRHYPALHGFTVIIFDRQKILLVLTDPKNREAGYSLRINSSGLAEALVEYFELVWKKARPVQL